MIRISLLATTLLLAAPAWPADIVGRASVVDGDTIDIHGIRIRFDGVDAPESRQLCQDGAGKRYRCGQMSANALATFLNASMPIRCLQTGKSYERVVAVCRRADGADVNRWLVTNGYAVDWPRYSHGRYSADQTKAQAARLGIWMGEYELPCAFRRRTC